MSWGSVTDCGGTAQFEMTILALVLAATGRYGILSYSVARPTNEIGVRMALGAERGELIRMVLREELMMRLLGVIAGVPASVAIARVISSCLFGITAPTSKHMSAPWLCCS